MKLESMTIEELVGEAYEVGHAHGRNAINTALGRPLERLNDGWGPIAEEIERRLKKPTRPDKEG